MTQLKSGQVHQVVVEHFIYARVDQLIRFCFVLFVSLFLQFRQQTIKNLTDIIPIHERSLSQQQAL